MATNILWSSPQSCWPLQNIHISNDNGSFTLYLNVFFPLSLPRLFTGLRRLYIWATRRAYYRNRNFEAFARTWVNQHPYLVWVCVANHLSFLCCPIMCLYVLNFVLWCPLRFSHENDVRFVFTSSCLYERSCIIYVICVCLCIVVSSTYCVVFLLCFSQSCSIYVASSTGLSIFDCPFVIL
jgi:hypothetical protein